jgi:hypothetical protein
MLSRKKNKKVLRIQIKKKIFPLTKKICMIKKKFSNKRYKKLQIFLVKDGLSLFIFNKEKGSLKIKLITAEKRGS